jgi:hypothetical protein
MLPVTFVGIDVAVAVAVSGVRTVIIVERRKLRCRGGVVPRRRVRKREVVGVDADRRVGVVHVVPAGVELRVHHLDHLVELEQEEIPGAVVVDRVRVVGVAVLDAQALVPDAERCLLEDIRWRRSTKQRLARSHH